MTNLAYAAVIFTISTFAVRNLAEYVRAGIREDREAVNNPQVETQEAPAKPKRVEPTFKAP